MFDEPDIKTLNHKFKIKGSYEWASRPATKKEVEAARKDSKKGEWMALGRSCWVCNPAHTHLISEPNINCFSCGRLYHKGIDIVDYSGSELEKYTHLTEKKQSFNKKAR